MTSDEIKTKILNLESFWVGTDSERKSATQIASILGVNYHTRSDDRGGFYVYYLPNLKRTTCKR